MATSPHDGSSQSQRYEYPPLKFEDSTRVLTILPAKPGAPIAISLEEERLPQVKAYDALSYCWESDVRDQKVFCGDRHIFVTKTLLTALEHLRDENQPRRIWIDQICIDQDGQNGQKDSSSAKGPHHLTEKATQVAMMATIYNSASLVVIWLGPGSEGSTEAMQALETLVEQGTSAPQAMLTRLTNRGPLAISIHELLARSWFSRVWTVQEAALAKSSTFQCGMNQLRSQVLLDFNRQCQISKEGFWAEIAQSLSTAKGGDPSNINRNILDHVQTVSEIKILINDTKQQHSIYSHLHRLRSCGAKDDRDRIYSILSLLPAKTREAIGIPVYNEDFSREALYTRVSRIECGGLFLSESIGAAGRYNQRNDFNGPSWVADWAPVLSKGNIPTKVNHPLWFINDETIRKSGTPLFQASQGLPSPAVLHADGARLQMRGRVLDSVKDLADAFNLAGINPLSMSRQIKSCEERASRLNPQQEPSKVKTLTRRALICDLRISNQKSVYGGFYERPHDEHDLNAGFDSINFAGDLVAGIPTNPNFEFKMDCFKRILDIAVDLWKSRVFFVTQKGYIGIGPGCAPISGTDDRSECFTRKEDKICLINGCCTPFVIRPTPGDSGRWELIGECYLQGFMDYNEDALAGVPEQLIEFD